VIFSLVQILGSNSSIRHKMTLESKNEITFCITDNTQLFLKTRDGTPPCKPNDLLAKGGKYEVEGEMQVCEAFQMTSETVDGAFFVKITPPKVQYLATRVVCLQP
jgi:hypothetical protein